MFVCFGGDIVGGICCFKLFILFFVSPDLGETWDLHNSWGAYDFDEVVQTATSWGCGWWSHTFPTWAKLDKGKHPSEDYVCLLIVCWSTFTLYIALHIQSCRWICPRSWFPDSYQAHKWSAWEFCPSHCLGENCLRAFVCILVTSNETVNFLQFMWYINLPQTKKTHLFGLC